eukprot:CAMPEP_0181343252 /NCGR_PEP_ID=MMETSP1101-20121128/31480_1 /TAXON_ID=46948 /ORGANISM="Rhodomonas abbreviata, Strain Caron Lab Isolate" /LENGTH=188 /DNA_ID=CAMNT_0023454855 /DNA_START=30 /DNA_END=596 /DNA_ORIENTATION=+
MASESQPTIEEALRSCQASAPDTPLSPLAQVPVAETAPASPLEKRPITEQQILDVFYDCMDCARQTKVPFGHVSPALLLRHLHKFVDSNLPTVHVADLTACVILDEFFSAIVDHHFSFNFSIEMGKVLRDVEKTSAQPGDRTPLNNGRTGRWEKIVSWVKRPALLLPAKPGPARTKNKGCTCGKHHLE